MKIKTVPATDEFSREKSPGGSQAEGLRQVAEQIRIQSVLLENLTSAIKSLDGRLEPVMLFPSASQGKDALDAPLVPVANQLRTHNEEIRIAVETLDGFINRIQL